MKLGVITGSTRPGRHTHRQSLWIIKTATQIEGVEAEHVDLRDYPLPFFNEAMSPRYNQNREVDPAVAKWLKKINEFDAYVFVTPEYNHSIPGELKNVFDYMTWELKRKPAAVASHGSLGGARAAVHLKEILSEGQAVVIPQASMVAGMSDIISEDGELDVAVSQKPYEPQRQLHVMLAELKWYSDVLAPARAAA